jgi:hypothetical protein
MKVGFVTPFRVCHLQRYGVTVRGNVTSVDPPYVLRVLSVQAQIGIKGTYRFHPFLQATKALRESRAIALLCF